jgi:hypothetical protein
MKPICPLHKTELVVLDKYMYGCNKKTKGEYCPHIQYSPSELINDKGKVFEKTQDGS